MVRDRHDPPLPNVSWEVGITRLPLGTPVIRLIVQGTKVDLPVGDAVRLGTALSNAAMTFPAEVSRSLAD
ncbi:MAG: hypothetical protein RLZZ127_2572, partial [Planctomycetota bacterium]